MLKTFTQKGFTLVELLIVIIVIGIIASITIVSYSGVQNRANETSVKVDLSNIAKQVEIHKISLSKYPSIAQMETLKIKVNKAAYGVNPTGATGYYCVDAGGATFSIVTRVKSQMILKYNSTDGETSVFSGSQTPPGLCTDSGVIGGTFLAFTNNGVWNSWIDN